MMALLKSLQREKFFKNDEFFLKIQIINITIVISTHCKFFRKKNTSSKVRFLLSSLFKGIEFFASILIEKLIQNQGILYSDLKKLF